MSNASIKITQLGPITTGNLTASTVIPVVGLNVTATTQKVALGNIANFILLNAGTSLPAANISNLSYSVVNAAQPNITSVGNLTGLVINNIATFKIPGGGVGQFITTDGNGNLSWATGEGAGLPGGNANTIQYNSGSNTFAGSTNLTYDPANAQLNTVNFAASQATIYGNIAAVNVSVTTNLTANNANITHSITANGNITTGNFFIGDGRYLANITTVTSNFANFAGNITVSAQPNITSLGNLTGLQSNGVVFINNNTNSTSNATGALRVTGGIGATGNIHSGNEIHSRGNVIVGGNTLFVGPTADATGLTNPAMVIFHAGDQYIQAALKNSLSNGSADWVAYGDNGTDSQGWADMGFCSSTFNDANYTITGPGDGYLFVETFAGSYGGNLVLATGNLGTVKDIIFATNGFQSNNEFGRISHSQQQLHIKATTSSGNITSGALRVDGGVGIASNLNVGGIISGNGNGITSIPFNSVVGLGNVASLNRDGNSGNVLFGNGVFASLASSGYNDSNVALLLSSFGSNTINTTGNVSTGNISTGNILVNGNIIPNSNVSFDLGNLNNRFNDLYLSNSSIFLGDATLSANGNSLVVNNIQVIDSNISSIGNIAALNLDNSLSNILYGNGVFAPIFPASNGNSNINISVADGPVTVTAAGNTWSFETSGQLTFPGNQGYMYSPGGNDLKILNNQNAGFIQLGWQDGAVLTPSANLASNLTLNSTGVTLTTTNDSYTTTKDWIFDTTGLLTLPGGSTKIGNQYGAEAILSNVSFGVATQGNTTTFINWSDDIANTSLVTAIYLNAPNANPGDIHIRTGAVASPNIWQLNSDGNLVLANGNSVIRSIANSSLDPTLPNVSTMVLTPDQGYSSQALVLDPTAPGHIHLRAPGANIDEPYANLFLGGEATSFEITQGANNVARIHSGNLTWTFSNSSGASVIDLPGESYLRSNDDTIAIQSYDTANGIGRGIYIGSNGTLYFWDGNSQSVSIQQDNTNANITAIGNASITSNTSTWVFGSDGNLTIPGSSGGFIKTVANSSIGIAAIDNGTDNPAQLLSINSGSGNATTIISTYANSATIQTNAAGAIKTWTFDNAGNITVAGNIIFNSNLYQSSTGFLLSQNTDVGGQVEFNNRTMGYVADNNGTASLYARDIPTGSNNAVVTANGTNGTVLIRAANTSGAGSNKDWTFNGAGNLVLPGNTFAINYANGIQASAPTVDILNTNGLSTTYYPTFVENRTAGQIVRADVDLSYRTDTNTLTVNNISVTSNITSSLISGNFTGNTNGFPIGYMDIPQVSAGNVSLSLSDAGKHYYSNIAANATITIPTNSSVPFRTGSVVTFIIKSIGNIIINPSSGVNLFLAGNNISNVQRVVGPYGMATILKVEDDTWFINGTGVY